jgi:hypothetical protein
MTISNKYNQLQEGKISKKQFLEYTRKDNNLKGLITQVQSFDDTIRTLKSRRLISEIESGRVDKAVRSAMAELESNEHPSEEEISNAAAKWSEYYDLSNEETGSVATTLNNKINTDGSDYQYMNEDNFTDDEIDSEQNIPKNTPYDRYTDEIQNILRQKGLEDDDIITIFDSYPKIIKGNFEMGSSPHETIKTILKLGHGFNDYSSLNESYDNVDKERLKQDNLNPNQVADGTKIEWLKQKIKDIQKARQTAIKNLLKDPIFYTNLLAGVKPKKKRTDLPIELDKKFTNTVDKSNGMKDIPGIEKDVASANKAKAEIQKVPKYKEDTFKAQRAKGIKGVMDMPGKEKKIKLSEIQKIANAIQIALKEIQIQPNISLKNNLELEKFLIKNKNSFLNYVNNKMNLNLDLNHLEDIEFWGPSQSEDITDTIEVTIGDDDEGRNDLYVSLVDPEKDEEEKHLNNIIRDVSNGTILDFKGIKMYAQIGYNDWD